MQHKITFLLAALFIAPSLYSSSPQQDWQPNPESMHQALRAPQERATSTPPEHAYDPHEAQPCVFNKADQELMTKYGWSEDKYANNRHSATLLAFPSQLSLFVPAFFEQSTTPSPQQHEIHNQRVQGSSTPPSNELRQRLSTELVLQGQQLKVRQLWLQQIQQIQQKQQSPHSSPSSPHAMQHQVPYSHTPPAYNQYSPTMHTYVPHNQGMQQQGINSPRTSHSPHAGFRTPPPSCFSYMQFPQAPVNTPPAYNHYHPAMNHQFSPTAQINAAHNNPNMQHQATVQKTAAYATLAGHRNPLGLPPPCPIQHPQQLANTPLANFYRPQPHYGAPRQ